MANAVTEGPTGCTHICSERNRSWVQHNSLGHVIYRSLKYQPYSSVVRPKEMLIARHKTFSDHSQATHESAVRQEIPTMTFNKRGRKKKKKDKCGDVQQYQHMTVFHSLFTPVFGAHRTRSPLHKHSRHRYLVMRIRCSVESQVVGVINTRVLPASDIQLQT